MALWNAGLATAPDERRGAVRNAVECPAQLHLTVGIRPGTVADLSTSGARFHTESPPPVGMTALLKWQDHEAFCKVVWSRDGMCGVQFDRPLSPAMLDETLQEDARRNGPVAAVRNIPLGQRRSRP
jgi:hypothetical protein